MDALPVEVIGNILSLLAAVRDVIIASATCRKWREAARLHLRALHFCPADWPVYHELSVDQMEVLITQTILQTSCLRDLSLCLGDDEFSAAPVIAWLIYTRETLRFLTYMIQTRPFVNLLDRCGRHKLEALHIGNITICSVDPKVHKFPVLCSLTLSRVSISALDMKLLLVSCPKLESLSLINSSISLPTADGEATLELKSHSLKSFSLEEVSLDNITLDADNLESISLKDSTLEHFEVVSKGGLRILKMDDVSIMQFDVGQGMDNLEVVDLSNFTVIWPHLYQSISEACKLRWLKLWGPVDVEDEVMDLETIALCFPQLTRLALCYELENGVLLHTLKGSSLLEKVVALELGSTTINELFSQWISGILGRCPNLKRLVVHGNLSEAKVLEDYQKIARFNSFIVELMRKYFNIEINFVFC
ncbi:hypothetical protein O6H91_04G033300 [Diphasiastrum complanatum]|uniref:Uncharacterized protein n=1 Tax=Diphasiastrum complanatum TaxID=34168 RepID=A0ACC2DW11_DIPCM|nr:hypothetical protein O6H91_04G033300 [Diphasiastrum complanatum]